MSRHDPRAYVFDVLKAIGYIQQFAEGQSLEIYENNLLLRSGIERQFEIIGEALRRLTTANPAVPEIPKIISFRNQLAHGYDTIDNEVVWRAIDEDLPKLRLEMELLMVEYSQDKGQRG
jgi:uncharacterized protein with HEPN domain